MKALLIAAALIGLVVVFVAICGAAMVALLTDGTSEDPYQ